MIDRIKRINQLIKQKIAEILERELSFKDTLVTVQSVDTLKDLKYAKIRISVIPFEKSEKVLEILQKQIKNIQNNLGKAIQLKFIPKIKFEIDRGEEKAGRIERILKEL